MKLASVAAMLALLFGSAPILTAGATAQEDGDLPSISATTPPPYCSAVEHMGVLGYIVDQAWIIYRRVERSSPARVGWCACAKRCEAIDRLAVRYEAAAFQAYKLSRDPSIPGNQRQKYGEQATRLFGQRNLTVADFRSCIDKARPPLTPPIPGFDDIASADPIPGSCKVDIKLTIKQQWEIWCADYMAKYQTVAKNFIDTFKPVKVAEMTFTTRFVRNGGKQIYGGVATNMTQAEIDTFVKALTDLKVKDIPLGAARSYYDFKGKLTTIIKVDEPIKCPEK